MISKDEVLHIAKLARLELAPQEVEKMQKDLTAILDYFEVLKGAPKPGAELHLVKLDNGLRQDKAVEKPASLANNLIAGAPDTKDGYVKVKAIL